MSSHLKGPSEGDWSVFAEKVVAERDAALERVGVLEHAVRTLQEEAMRRDACTDFERGEYAGQDAMLRHITLLDEASNSLLAAAVKKCHFVQAPLRVLAELADKLPCASYSFEQQFDVKAARAFHSEFSLLQKRCELFAKDLVVDDEDAFI
jgi:hypothetical protein